MEISGDFGGFWCRKTLFLAPDGIVLALWAVHSHSARRGGP